MVDPRAQVRVLVPGVEVTDGDLDALFATYGVDTTTGGSAPRWVVHWVAADVALREGQRLIGGTGITAVEDIAVDDRRTVQMWWALADRLRARGDDIFAEEDADGPFVVAMGVGTRPEVTEWPM